MRRLISTLCALCLALVLMGVGTSVATATPAPEVKITPDVMLNFGTVPVGSEVLKPVTILNRTSDWVYYDGAAWPNLEHPGIPYPIGIWNRSFEPFPCYSIAPKSSCTLDFGFAPGEPGLFQSHFTITYSGFASQTILMQGVGQ